MIGTGRNKKSLTILYSIHNMDVAKYAYEFYVDLKLPITYRSQKTAQQKGSIIN